MTIIHSESEFVKNLVEALGIQPTWRRIIIDIDYQSAVVIYVEMLADEQRLNILPINVEGMKILMIRDVK